MFSERLLSRAFLSRGNSILLSSLLVPFVIICSALLSFAGDHAVVLQYHHFGDDTPASTSVTMEQFRSHLAYLKEHRYRVLPVEQVIGLLKSGRDLPDNAVAITIDDAYDSVYERAYPLLREYGYPFTVFVSTSGVVKGIKSYMTWDQMKEMQENGASFANHSHSHDYLIQRLKGENAGDWKVRVKEDITTAGSILKDKLNVDSALFAYPYGEFNTALKGIVKELDLIGIGQHSGPVWSGSDFGALPRFPMAAHFAEMESFITKVRSLPLPVIAAAPDDTELSEGMDIPVLRLTLKPNEYRPDSIACFSSGQGRITTSWIDREKLILEVTAKEPLPQGRSRYNCTAAHTSGDRFYWYSHPWIRPGK